jgi:hypothetical protein
MMCANTTAAIVPAALMMAAVMMGSSLDPGFIAGILKDT